MALCSIIVPGGCFGSHACIILDPEIPDAVVAPDDAASCCCLFLPPPPLPTPAGLLKSGSKSGTSNDTSRSADDYGAGPLVSIENDVSGKALANDASKASRLLILLPLPPLAVIEEFVFCLAPAPPTVTSPPLGAVMSPSMRSSELFDLRE